MILSIGPYPPPLGGISVHLQRLKAHLDRDGYKNAVWSRSQAKDHENNIRPVRQKWLRPLLFFNPRYSLIHYHVSGFEARSLASSMCRAYKNRKHIITLHGDALRFVADHPEHSKSIFEPFDAVLSVKPGDAERLHAMGFSRNIRYISPFIPPVDEDLAIQSDIVSNFVNKHSLTLCANASKIVFHDQQELYGLDLCVEMMRQVCKVRKDVGLVFYLSKSNNAEYIAEQKVKAEKYGVAQHILIHESEEQFYPLIRRSAIFLRPTNTDGEPLSIRESLYFGVPVITSDVVQRPNGCVLFRNRDPNDLAEKVLDVLGNMSDHCLRVATLPTVSGLSELIALYQQLGEQPVQF